MLPGYSILATQSFFLLLSLKKRFIPRTSSLISSQVLVGYGPIGPHGKPKTHQPRLPFRYRILGKVTVHIFFLYKRVIKRIRLGGSNKQRDKKQANTRQ